MSAAAEAPLPLTPYAAALSRSERRGAKAAYAVRLRAASHATVAMNAG